MIVLPEVYLARHGETAWTLTGQHTGRTDIPLTARGEDQARSLAQRLAEAMFVRVLTSPLARAVQTCALAGFGGQAALDTDVQEWDYGQYEGQRTADIRQARPGWDLFRDGCPGGESVAVEGTVVVFSHGHVLRVLAARWLGLPAGAARYLVLSTAALSILGYEHNTRDEPVLRLWNDTHHVVEEHKESVEARGTP